MKFIAAPSKAKYLTEGKVYIGNLVIVTEESNGRIESKLKVAIYDDAERWATYHPSYFLPYED